MNILENTSLKYLNTFGIDIKARFFVEIESREQLIQLITSPRFKDTPKLILGGGSNLLFTQDFNGIVIKINIKGIETVNENENYVWLRCGAGVNWHEFVVDCISKGYGGLENLSLIPGTVGAAPMQNIGAYGVELQEVFYELEAIAIQTGHSHVFDKDACQFDYRYSIFKDSAKGQYVIVHVTFKLSKNPKFNISYGAIQETLRQLGYHELSLTTISEAVVHIRKSKLPDPKEIGNAGSFFKNPVIDKEQYQNLKEQYPDIPGYDVDSNYIKVPAGWLIERCGWKGKRIGDTGVHKNQALVLVNFGNAKGKDIELLAIRINESVQKMFGIVLTPEVNIV